MLNTRFSLICKTLHLHEVDRKETHFVPNVQNNIDLAQKVAFWETFEIQSPIKLLVNVQIRELARWSRAAFSV